MKPLYQIKVPTWKLGIKYHSIWKVDEMKDGCIYKTSDTGYYVEDGVEIPDGYLKAATSTLALRKEFENITVATFGE